MKGKSNGTINPVMTLSSSGNLGIGTATPQGTLTLHDSNGESESFTVADVRMFKDMCGFIEYMSKVDPKFADYMVAYRAAQKVTK